MMRMHLNFIFYQPYQNANKADIIHQSHSHCLLLHGSQARIPNIPIASQRLWRNAKRLSEALGADGVNAYTDGNGNDQKGEDIADRRGSVRDVCRGFDRGCGK